MISSSVFFLENCVKIQKHLCDSFEPEKAKESEGVLSAPSSVCRSSSQATYSLQNLHPGWLRGKVRGQKKKGFKKSGILSVKLEFWITEGDSHFDQLAASPLWVLAGVH